MMSLGSGHDVMGSGHDVMGSGHDVMGSGHDVDDVLRWDVRLQF